MSFPACFSPMSTAMSTASTVSTATDTWVRNTDLDTLMDRYRQEVITAEGADGEKGQALSAAWDFLERAKADVLLEQETSAVAEEGVDAPEEPQESESPDVVEMQLQITKNLHEEEELKRQEKALTADSERYEEMISRCLALGDVLLGSGPNASS